MDFLPFSLASLLACLFLSFLGILIFLNVFGLPGNWILVAFVALWKWCHPLAENLGLFFWVLLIGLAVIGELLEWGMQIVKARRYGSTSSGTFCGMIGAFIGAVLLAPLFWGLGALLGAMGGAWLGCFLMEICSGKSAEKASEAAMGAMLGRLLGTVCKCGVGMTMLALTARRIWPSEPTSPSLQLEAMARLMEQLAVTVC
ncbi:MAG: DUF456 domain-containing protein [Desulfovibrio sp.]|nr:DUF456 domain-containing protein [Desulfovibrio sp.]